MFFSISPQMSLQLHAKRANRNVIDCLHTMVVCANYEASMHAVKKLPAEKTASDLPNQLSCTSSVTSLTSATGCLTRHSDEQTSNPVRRSNGPVHSEIVFCRDRNNVSERPDHSIRDKDKGISEETAGLDQQLGVPKPGISLLL